MLVALHNNGILLQLLPGRTIIGKAIHYKDICEIGSINCDASYFPDQETGHLYQGDPPELVCTLDDLIQYTAIEKAQLIDCDTGIAIDKAVHPLAGTDESIGTIRDMVVQIINAIGLAPTADFKRLNEIAIAAIKEAAARKAKL